MKIIFSNYDDIKNPYYGGGGAFAVHEVAKRLAKTHTVSVLTGKYPGSKNEIIDGVEYKRVGAHILSARLGQLLFQLCLPWYAVREQFDVWVESFTPPISTAFLPLFTKKTVVGVTHLLGGVAMREKYGIPFDIVERFGLRYYKHIIVLQEELKKKLLEISPATKTYIIPNGASEEVFAQKQLPKQNYIAFLGRIDFKQKGLDILLKAYQKVEKEIGLSLKIAGNGLPADMVKLETMVRDLELEGKVEIVGRLSGQDKYNFLNSAQFLAMPSRVENFALVLIEAFALGLPAVVCDISGVKWAPASAAIKVECSSVEKYADALLKLAQDQDLREAMAKSAREVAKKYTWNDIAQQYEELLTSIVQKS